MGHTLQLQFVKKIENPTTHQFKVKSPDGRWDYVDLNDEFDLYSIFDYDSMSFYNSLIEKGHWREGVVDFLKKTDGRFYLDDEGYEATIYTHDEISEFVDLLEKETDRPEINLTSIYKHLLSDRRGRIPLKDELKEIKERIETAKTKGYYFKCLDR
jgi:hypothetical protein